MLDFSEQFILRESDFNCYGNIRVSSILDFFQTVAANHAERIGMGFEAMKKKGIAWVITKTKLDIFEPLKSGELITVRTIPHPKGLLDYTRDYFIYRNGTLVIKGSSQWVHIDFKLRKIVRPACDYNDDFVNEFAYDNPRIEKIMPFENSKPFVFTPTLSDTDHNGHINNAKYADMIFCANEGETRLPKQVIMNFIAETFCKQPLNIFVDKPTKNQTLFCAKKESTVLFSCRIDY